MTDTSSTPSKRIGILSLHNSKETKAIANAVSDLGHEPVWLRRSNLTSTVRDDEITADPAVDVVANRLLLTKSDRPLEELGLAYSFPESCTVLNPPAAVMRTMHKYGASTLMAESGVPVPDAFLGLSTERLEAGLERFEGPAVHKALVGTNGSYMSRVEEGPVAARVARRRAFLQEFLNTDRDRVYDLRVYVVDDEVVGAMRRYAPEGDWRTNVALGGDVEDATGDLDRGAAECAVRAVEALGLDYAGVDLVRTGEWTVLEVNATAGFKGLFEATGTSPAPYIAAQAIERAGGHVEGDAVERLARELDDSVPACKPDPVEDDDGGVIGFAEQVAIAGGEGAETVVAKADTGAARTSIDADLAASVGAGPVVGTVAVKSGTGPTRQRALVELDVRVDGTWQTVDASVEDRGHLSHPMLVGRDVLEGYRVDIGRREPEGATDASPGAVAVDERVEEPATDGGTDER